MEQSKKIKTLLVDDEFLALKLLEQFALSFPQLKIVGKVKSAQAAQEIMEKEKVDLLFLDIQMPQLSGNQFLRGLENPPITIFTTAYPDYAVEAFELNAVDYLLKPFSFERFSLAVKKAEEKINVPDENEELFMIIKSDGKFSKINLNDILYIEGLKEYVKIICKEKKYVILESLKNMEEQLPSSHFLRVHKSYIVSKSKVTDKEGFFIFLRKIKIPISRKKKIEIMKELF